jgi:hypothetical protein
MSEKLSFWKSAGLRLMLGVWTVHTRNRSLYRWKRSRWQEADGANEGIVKIKGYEI